MADPFGGVFKSSTASQSQSAGTSLKKSQQIQQQAASAATAAGAQVQALNEAAMYKQFGYEMDEDMRQEQAALAKEELDLKNKALELDAKVKTAGMKNKADIAMMKAESQENIAAMQSAAAVEAAQADAAAKVSAAEQQAAITSKKFALDTTTSMYKRALSVAANPDALPETVYKATNFAVEMSSSLGAVYGSPEFTNSLNSIATTVIGSAATAAGKTGMVFTGDGVAVDPSVYNGYTSAQSLANEGLYDDWYGVDAGFTQYYDNLIATGQTMTPAQVGMEATQMALGANRAMRKADDSESILFNSPIYENYLDSFLGGR